LHGSLTGHGRLDRGRLSRRAGIERRIASCLSVLDPRMNPAFAGFTPCTSSEGAVQYNSRVASVLRTGAQICRPVSLAVVTAMKTKTFCVLFAVCMAVLSFSGMYSAFSCPFCDAPTLMMAERIQQCDHLLLAKWIGGEKPTELRGGVSRFEVIDVGFTKNDRFAKGQILEMPQYIAGSGSGTYTLMGPEDRLEDWDSPAEVTEVGWEYLSKMPPTVTDPKAQSERLMYFVPYFEHPDQLVANDAFAEFASAPYATIKPLSSQMPREKFLQWLADPKTPVTHIGFYGLMAGLCGKPEDAAILEKKIVVLDSEFRLGIEGVMAGYMLLAGEEGLKRLEETKMHATVAMTTDGKEKRLPFSEVYAVMQALRFMWTYEPDRLPKERLMQSMRILLDNPQIADLVITDLARWKDWSIQDRLVAMYDEEAFAIPSIRRAIVRYLYYCSLEKGEPAGDGTVTRPDYAVQAEAHLKAIELKDPKTVSDAKRYSLR
jgi:hypothetical protein